MVHIINHIDTMYHNNIYLTYARTHGIHVIPSIKLEYQLFNNLDKH